MNSRSFSDIHSPVGRYVAGILLGLILASAIVPQGYMPSIQADGSVKIVLCSAVGSTLTTEAEADPTDDTCAFGVLSPIGIQSLELGSHGIKQQVSITPSEQFNAGSYPHFIAYPRGPPAIS
ncbi:MAG: hypothetical protein VW313_10565 [Gammaproteobacteria bacterium]